MALPHIGGDIETGRSVVTIDQQIQRVRDFHGEPMAAFAELWIHRALRTTPIEPAIIAPAIEALYGAAGFGKPHIIVVPSPGVLAFAGTFADHIWNARKTRPDYDPAHPDADGLDIPADCRGIAAATHQAIRAATVILPHTERKVPREPDVWLATLEATYSPADLATVEALDGKVWMKTRDALEEVVALNCWNEYLRDAMRDAFGNSKPTELMAKAMQDWAAPLASAVFGEGAETQRVVREAADWWRQSRAGNCSLHDTACIAAARDVHALALPEHAAFAIWERSLVNAAYHYLHPEFCLVCDFPEAIDLADMKHSTQVRTRSLQERQAAPTMRWRDGWLV